jgi:death-on-curing protein
MLVFLALNGYELSYNQRELSDVILALASGNIGEKEILQWIIKHQQ